MTDIKLGDTEISAHQPAASKLARGAVMGLFALVSATGAAAWQHYGDDAKAMLARYAPPFALAALASPEKPGAAEQPAAVVTQASAAQAAAQTAPAADTAMPATAPGSPDQTQVSASIHMIVSQFGKYFGRKGRAVIARKCDSGNDANE